MILVAVEEEATTVDQVEASRNDYCCIYFKLHTFVVSIIICTPGFNASHVYVTHLKDARRLQIVVAN